jgi:hypothetical protein
MNETQKLSLSEKFALVLPPRSALWAGVETIGRCRTIILVLWPSQIGRPISPGAGQRLRHAKPRFDEKIDVETIRAPKVIRALASTIISFYCAHLRTRLLRASIA